MCAVKKELGGLHTVGERPKVKTQICVVELENAEGG